VRVERAVDEGARGGASLGRECLGAEGGGVKAAPTEAADEEGGAEGGRGAQGMCERINDGGYFGGAGADHEGDE
jgi:hypothetical protein